MLLVLGVMLGLSLLLIGLYRNTTGYPAVTEPKPDEAMCQARLDTWLYGHEWVALRGVQQWEQFKTHLGECVK
jgi:hypothetical protein